MTRGEEKALALHRWLADRLRDDPLQLELPRRRLEWLRSRNPAGAAYYDQWTRLLDGPFEALLAAMVSTSDLAFSLRQESPFVDLVDQRVRARIYRAVAHAIDRERGA